MKQHIWKLISLGLGIALFFSISMRGIEKQEYNEQKLDQIYSIYSAIDELIPFTRQITADHLQLEKEEEDLILTQLKIAYMNHFEQVADLFDDTILDDDMDDFLSDFDEVMTTYINMDSKDEAARANANLKDLMERVMDMHVEYDNDIN